MFITGQMKDLEALANLLETLAVAARAEVDDALANGKPLPVKALRSLDAWFLSNENISAICGTATANSPLANRRPSIVTTPRLTGAICALIVVDIFVLHSYRFVGATPKFNASVWLAVFYHDRVLNKTLDTAIGSL